MNRAIAVWLFFRALRWAAWVFFFGFSVCFWLDRAPWLTGFGHLQHITEVFMFFPAVIATFAGFLELMMRERASIARPEFGQLIPPKAAA